MNVLGWLKNVLACIWRYPLQTGLLIASAVVCYCWVCPYFAGILGVTGIVWAAQQTK